MEIWDRTERNAILTELEKRGYPFQNFVLKKENSMPVEIGKGSSAFIYSVQKKGKPETEYALKVIGFSGQNYGKKGLSDNVYQVRGFSTFHIIHIYKFTELTIVFDDLENIISIENGNNIHNTGKKSLRLQFILMEKLIPIKQYGKDGRAFFVPDDLNKGIEKEVLALGFDIALALQDIHKKGMIHRDIKPENIFYHESMKKYCLGDFGMSKVTETGLAETTIYTNGYAAPEVFQGAGKTEYDSLIDMYSLGMVLYALMNDGKFPFEDSEGLHSEKQYSPGVNFPAPLHASEAFSKIILKMTEYDPEDRYQSMEEVVYELRKLIFSKPAAIVMKNNSYFVFVGFMLLTFAAVLLPYSIPGNISAVPKWVAMYEAVCQNTFYKFLIVLFIVDFIISVIQKNPDTTLGPLIYIFDAVFIFSTGFSVWKLVILLIILYSEWVIKAIPYFLTVLIFSTALSKNLVNAGLTSSLKNFDYAMLLILCSLLFFWLAAVFERLSRSDRRWI